MGRERSTRRGNAAVSASVCGEDVGEFGGEHHALRQPLQLPHLGGLDARVVRGIELPEALREQDAQRVAQRAEAFLTAFTLYSGGWAI